MKNISVLLSVHSGISLENFIDSIRSITYDQVLKPKELIVVFDGFLSIQYSKFLDNINISDLRIKKINTYSNRGLGIALQIGLTHCNEEYIARMDADDISVPERFIKQFEFHERYPDVDVVGSYIDIFDKDNQLNSEKSIIEKYPINNKGCLKSFEFKDPLAHPSVMFKRRFFIKAGTYSSLRKNQDTELWYRGFRSNCVFANIPEPLLKFRLNKETIIRRKNVYSLIILFFLRLKIGIKLNYGIKSTLFNLIKIFSFIIIPPFLLKKLYEVYFKIKSNRNF